MREVAQRLLVHYFRNAGVVTEQDNVVEIESIVDEIIDAVEREMHPRGRRLTCVLCGCEKDDEYFDGWRSCIGAPGLSGKVDIDRPECDFCDALGAKAVSS